jgi:diaminopimelate epimerase
VGREGLPRALEKFSRAILDRHTGIGADGLLVLMPAREPSHAARVRFFNADGSEAEMSGNGIRCAGAFLAELMPEERTFLVETPAGLKSLEKVKAGEPTWLFRAGMGAPVLEPEKIPFKGKNAAAPVTRYELRTQKGPLAVTVTSMGNPHCSIFVEQFAASGVSPAGNRRSLGGVRERPQGPPLQAALAGDWEALGREIETSPLFPNRTNVEFVKVISRREIAVRFWERGVGHTMSSGTGSCAAAVASILNGLTERRVRVLTEAGVLEVDWPTNEEVTLTGPVERVGCGTYEFGGKP